MPVIAAILSSFIFGSVLLGSQIPQRQNDLIVNDARQLLLSGKLNEARSLIDSALKLSPDDPALHGMSAEIYHVDGKLPASLREFEKMDDLAECDSCHSALDSMAVICSSMNKKEDAKEILVRAIKKGSKFARSMLAVELSAEADKLVVQGEYNDALAALTKASRLSDDTLIAQKRVLTLRLLGNVEEEYRTACLQILEKNPESVFALKQLESFYFQAGLKNIRRGMYPQAIVAFEKACEYHPMWGAALIKIGTCYEILRDTQKAFVNYSNSILDSSVMTEAKSSVARIYRGWKKYNQAFYVLQEGLDVQPSEIVLWDELGRLYRDLNKKNEFIECWKMKATLGDYTSYAELQGWGVKLDSIKFSLFPWLKKKPFAQSGDSWLSGDDPADFVPVDKPPVILEMATPEYPEFAKRIGAEGVVWVKILVGIDGLVAKALILKTDNEIFNVSAWEAAKRYKFSPAMKDNRPVAVWVSQPFRFKLTK